MFYGMWPFLTPGQTFPSTPKSKFISDWNMYHVQYIPRNMHTVFFAVLRCGYTLTDFPISIRLTSLALWQSNDCRSASKTTLMNMDKYLMWIHYERLHNHNKAKHNKAVCILLGIYSIKLRDIRTCDATFITIEPFYEHGLTLILVWKTNYIYHIALYWACDCLSMLGLKLNHVSKKIPGTYYHPCVGTAYLRG